MASRLKRTAFFFGAFFSGDRVASNAWSGAVVTYQPKPPVVDDPSEPRTSPFSVSLKPRGSARRFSSRARRRAALVFEASAASRLRRRRSRRRPLRRASDAAARRSVATASRRSQRASEIAAYVNTTARSGVATSARRVRFHDGMVQRRVARRRRRGACARGVGARMCALRFWRAVAVGDRRQS